MNHRTWHLNNEEMADPLAPPPRSAWDRWGRRWAGHALALAATAALATAGAGITNQLMTGPTVCPDVEEDPWSSGT